MRLSSSFSNDLNYFFSFSGMKQEARSSIPIDSIKGFYLNFDSAINSCVLSLSDLISNENQ